MPRALITGITGQDGQHLAELLHSKGYEVFGVVKGQNNPKAELVSQELPVRRARERRSRRPPFARRGARVHAAARGVQPRRDLVRRPLVQASRAHRQHHGPRRAPDARGDPDDRRLREQPDPLLPGVVVGDVRQGPRDAAEREDAVLPSVALRLREGLRPRHHGELPRLVRACSRARASCSTTRASGVASSS